MRHTVRTAAALALAAAGLVLAGCGGPAAVERSQQLQLAAMIQYRDEMAAYHEKVQMQLAADKRNELDTALAASLAQEADAEGHVAVAVALEKTQKRVALEDQFRVSLARLDGEFAQRQVAIGRAIDLAQGTLGLIQDYSRLGAIVRSLFVREVESQQLVTNYETERSQTHAGTTSEPQASGR